MTDPLPIRALHLAAGVASTAAWAIADTLRGASEHLDDAAELAQNVGHVVIEAACYVTELTQRP